jgi:hypothetical protein
VQTWRLGTATRNDIAQGVWMVTQDCTGTGENELTVGAGAFVREATPDGDLQISPTSRFVRAHSGETGLVPTSCLNQIALHENAPPVDQENPGPAPEYPPEEIVSEEEGLIDRISAANFKAYPTPCRRFNIFRGIQSTDKLGRDTNQVFHSSGINILPGHFYFMGNSPPPNDIPVVTDINGITGEANYRSLQHLVSPWGLESEKIIPRMNERTVNFKKTLVPLPLRRLTKGYRAQKREGIPEFLAGEIVRIGEAITNARCTIYDYEGNPGKGYYKDLEVIGQSLGTGHYPFGVVLDGKLRAKQKEADAGGMRLRSHKQVQQAEESSEEEGNEGDEDIEEDEIEEDEPTDEEGNEGDEEIEEDEIGEDEPTDEEEREEGEEGGGSGEGAGKRPRDDDADNEESPQTKQRKRVAGRH